MIKKQQMHQAATGLDGKNAPKRHNRKKSSVISLPGMMQFEFVCSKLEQTNYNIKLKPYCEAINFNSQYIEGERDIAIAKQWDAGRTQAAEGNNYEVIYRC